MSKIYTLDPPAGFFVFADLPYLEQLLTCSPQLTQVGLLFLNSLLLTSKMSKVHHITTCLLYLKWHLITTHAYSYLSSWDWDLFYTWSFWSTFHSARRLLLPHRFYPTHLTHKVDKLILYKHLLDPTLFLCCMASLFLLTISTKAITIPRGITAITMKNNIINISQESIFIPKSLLN